MSKKLTKAGFTLLEILLVVGIISVLAGIVIVAINPARQLAQVRNTERKSDLKQINNAIQQFYIDNKFYPASTTDYVSSLLEICDTGSRPGPQADGADPVDCTDLVDLSELVPVYITAIPVDPQGSTLSFIPKALATTNGTGYLLGLEDNKVVLTAPQAELDAVIAIGTSTATTTPDVGGGVCDAMGGTETTDGGYKIHTFTSSGTFTVNSDSCDVEVLVVAGGGGGGKNRGGGGGAGGLVYESSFPVTAGDITVTVGAGGAIVNTEINGSDGEDSVFDTITALGGGGGGRDSSAGNDGGSGGGASDCGGNCSGDTLDPSQGNNGGEGVRIGDVYPAGGGGGAGGPGADGAGSVGGNGGVGLEYSQFASVGGSPAGWFAGGGGGGNYGGSGLSSGGNGGGGAGGEYFDTEGTDGTPNTGGGGGGQGNGSGTTAGGSGIVIVRYAI